MHSRRMIQNLICCFLVISVLTVLVGPVAALDVASNSVATTDKQNLIYRGNLDKIRGDAPTMTEEDSQLALDLISEKAKIEQQVQNIHCVDAYTTNEIATKELRLRNIEMQLDAMGVVPLSMEDIYILTNSRPGAAEVPSDSNYVHYYGLSTYIDNYEVWSIVAVSTGYDQSAISVPLYTDGTFTLYNADTYLPEDFNQCLDITTQFASIILDDAFEDYPILNYISTFYDIATYFNPTATQKVTITYDINQVFVFSYVADISTNYFTYTLVGEQKQGNFVMIAYSFQNGSSSVEQIATEEYLTRATHYADYAYAVNLYRNSQTRVQSYAGNVNIKLDGNIIKTISMPLYSELWSIPGT